MSRPRARCVYCGRAPRARPGRLCWKCYYTPGVRAACATGTPGATAPEPTAAELDALIAERSRPENLPAWWPKGVHS